MGSAAVAGALLAGIPTAQAAPPLSPPKSVEALVYSTMPSSTTHRPEMALDGDRATYFQSVYGVGDGDDFLILLSQPIPVRSIKVVTGDGEGQDVVTNGNVEVTPDSNDFGQFHKVAAFDGAGVADAKSLGDQPVQALRIRLNRRNGLPSLVIREITIDSPVSIAHVALGPGRGFADVSQAPDLADWAKRAEKQMEEFWPDTASLLYSDGFITPNLLHVIYRTGPGVTDVAATGGGVMTVNSAYARKHMDDTGLTVHEMAHAVQSMSAYNPVWLVEGIADYVRWVKFEPQNFHPQINVQKATYHDAYRTTATFLGWCELHYDSGLVTKLNRAIRVGNYNEAMFTKYCGKDVNTLWSEFTAAYTADPVGILTPPVPPADRPRTLPVVRAGSSISVDLSARFDTMGVYKDGASFPETGGFDAGGAAYSATLLGTTQQGNDLTFSIGKPGVANVLACAGNVVPLPEGKHTSLWLLGAAVEGAQRNQVFTVTYTDGTTQEFAQNISDWFQPGKFPGETRAVKMAYRNMANGLKDPRTFYLYRYGFALHSDKAVKSITLPSNPNVRLMALVLAD